MDIVQHISELIYDHDCVIVPELGGFVSNYQPATIHPAQHQFHPPAKNILFNEALKSNDGLLANHIAKHHKIPFESAMEKIGEFVAEVKQLLGNGQTVDLKNIGRLSPDRSGIIRFEQNTKVNFLKDVYGMSSFVSPAIRRDAGRSAKVLKPAFAEEQKRGQQNQATTLAFKIAASLALVVMLGIAGFNYFRNPTPDTQESGLHTSISELVNHPAENDGMNDARPDAGDKSSLNKFAHDQQGKQDDVSAQPEKTMSSEQAEDIEDTHDKPNTNQPEKPDETILSKPDAVAKPYRKKYHLIAGSFLDVENAGTLIDTYLESGFEPTAIGPTTNGYYRVSIAAYLRKDKALTELEKARQAFNPNIWLLRH